MSTNNPSLVITFTDPKASSAAESWWLRMEQEKIKKDTATVSEAAGLIDALFDIEPCNPEQEQSGGEEQPVDDRGEIAPPVPQKTYFELLAELFSPVSCQVLADGTSKAIIRVYKSHRNEPYKLVVKNGAVIQTVHVEEQVEVNVTVKDTSSVDLKYPVISSFSASWNGLIFDQNGADTGPEITLAGSTLNFGKAVTGRVQASFLTEYDRMTVSIKGDAEGKPQEGNILAFYHGMAFELTTEPQVVDEDFQSPCPEIHVDSKCDEDHVCYQVEKHYSLCHCTGDKINRYTTEPVEIACPDDWCYAHDWSWSQDVFWKEIFDGYVNCEHTFEGSPGNEGAKYYVNDPDYYEDKCCYPPDFPLPQCLEYTSKHSGGAGFDKEEYRGIYGPDTQFVAVKPEDGDCGTITVKQFVLPVNCCDVATPIAWDTDNSVEVIADNSSGVVYVTGGIAPYTWSVRGNGFYLDYHRTIRDGITNSPWVRVYTKNSCGVCDITVTDGCSSVSEYVASTVGQWENHVQDFVTARYENLRLVPTNSGHGNEFNCCSGTPNVDGTWCEYIGSNGHRVGKGVNAKYKVTEEIYHRYYGGDGIDGQCTGLNCGSTVYHWNSVPGYCSDWCWKYPDWTNYNCDYLHYRYVDIWVC